MTTLSQARRKWKETIRQYQKIRPTRTAVLGDGRATAEANLIVPGRPDYVFARDKIGDANFFQVLNNGAVQPAFNLPVVIGLPVPGEKIEEPAIIGIHYAGLGSIPSDSIPRVGPHHQQHEFRGGDDVIIEPRQFTPGLIYPTSPASMRVKINTLIYYWDTWERLSATISGDLTSYIPSSGYVAFVLIALDPETGQIVYRSNILSSGSQDVILGIFNTTVPAPAGNEIPLGYVRLLSTTTAIDWTETADNIGDARLWVNPPMLNVLDRLRQLEGYTGNPPSLATMGVAQYSVDDIAGGDVTGAGETNRVAYWSGVATLTNSSVFTFDGVGVGIGVAPSSLNKLGIVQSSTTTDSTGIFVSFTGSATTGAGIQVSYTGTSATLAYGILSSLSGPTGNIVSGYFSTVGGIDTVALQAVEGSGSGANFGLLIGSQPVGTTDYSIYNASANNVYLGTGNVGVGVTPLNTIKFHVNVGTNQNLWVRSVSGNLQLEAGNDSGSAVVQMNLAASTFVLDGGGVQVGVPTGGNKGGGTINVATEIYKNNSAYGNPDFVLEQWVTGQIVKYADRPRATDYRRLTLGEIEDYVRANYRLPRIGDEPTGVFDMTDIALEKIEELFTFVIEMNKRIGELEAKSRQSWES